MLPLGCLPLWGREGVTLLLLANGGDSTCSPEPPLRIAMLRELPSRKFLQSGDYNSGGVKPSRAS